MVRITFWISLPGLKCEGQDAMCTTGLSRLSEYYASGFLFSPQIRPLNEPKSVVTDAALPVSPRRMNKTLSHSRDILLMLMKQRPVAAEEHLGIEQSPCGVWSPLVDSNNSENIFFFDCCSDSFRFRPWNLDRLLEFLEEQRRCWFGTQR